MFRTLNEISVSGNRVLMRVDFNVPLDADLSVTDDTRIRAAIPSIRHILEHKGRLVLCSHLGRPKGERIEKFSLKPAALRLGELLEKEVVFVPDCVGPDVERAVASLPEGGVALLENLRFHAGETKNDPAFSAALASLADVYVNDAFAVSHRAHASVVGVAERVQIRAAGFLLEKEIRYFEKAMKDPARPLVAILGGAKVSGKLGAIRNILTIVDTLIIGGAMANTFLVSQGIGMGTSLVEPDLVQTAAHILKDAREAGKKIYLPVDFVVATELSPSAATKIVPAMEVPNGWMALDIGPATVTLFCEAIADARTIVWNGPMGAFETDAFSRGTTAMAQAVGSSHALTIVGGGDTNAAIHKAGEERNVSYMSTGGGAFLALLEGKKLPGIAVLEKDGDGK
ncbi:MAG: phosphoglycerate kinase [Deltaproteobacteria bacterium]